jgi:hypothetical protein
MTPKPTAGTESLKQITHLAAALKAPRITEAAARLADHARDTGWTHEDYLAAVLEREVAARGASGARLRIRAAGFGAVKTLDDFDFDHQPIRPHPDPSPGLRCLPGRAPQRRPARPAGHRQDTPSHRPGRRRRPPRTPRPVRDRHRLGHPPHRRPRPRPPRDRADPAATVWADHHRRGRLPTLRPGRRQPLLPTRLLPVRARLPDPHQQPAVQLLGRRLRRPDRRRRDDRPHRPPRRRHRPQRRLLPPTRPRRRHPAQHQSRARIPTLKPLTLRPPKPISFQAPSTSVLRPSGASEETRNRSLPTTETAPVCGPGRTTRWYPSPHDRHSGVSPEFLSSTRAHP